jgi:hypothetical protein
MIRSTDEINRLVTNFEQRDWCNAASERALLLGSNAGKYYDILRRISVKIRLESEIYVKKNTIGTCYILYMNVQVRVCRVWIIPTYEIIIVIKMKSVFRLQLRVLSISSIAPQLAPKTITLDIGEIWFFFSIFHCAITWYLRM